MMHTTMVPFITRYPRLHTGKTLHYQRDSSYYMKLTKISDSQYSGLICIKYVNGTHPSHHTILSESQQLFSIFLHYLDYKSLYQMGIPTQHSFTFSIEFSTSIPTNKHPKILHQTCYYLNMHYSHYKFEISATSDNQITYEPTRSDLPVNPYLLLENIPYLFSL
jgi:hypothetical protein